MSQLFDLKKCPFGQQGCGKEGMLCEKCEKTFMESTKTICPDGNPRCSETSPCDLCQATAQSLVQTNGCDVVPIQPIHDSVNQEICSECGKTLGTNTLTCGICASITELPSNPAQPNIRYNSDFGPMEYSFGPCTDTTTVITLDDFKKSFDASKVHGFPFTGITNFNKIRPSLFRKLIRENTVIGIEGINNSCFYVVLFWILSQGNMHELINTDCLSGHILYKILWELRCRLFVNRDIVEAFRLSLLEYPIFQRSKSNFKNEMDDFGYLLSLFEDDEIQILNKKTEPSFSCTGCSFHIHESIREQSCSSIQEALCASVLSNFNVPENGSIISFQFCQHKSDHFKKQTLGTMYDFPHDGIVLAGKLLRPKMFIIYNSQHYSVVLYVGETFFLTNSLSASLCGHFLPETCEISPYDAMLLFRNHTHTIVFECCGDAPQQPAPCADVAWFFPPPQPAPCADVAWFFPPPPPAPCADVVPNHESPTSCANVETILQQPAPYPSFKFEWNYLKCSIPIGIKLDGNWKYSCVISSTCTFTADGTFYTRDIHCDRTYVYNSHEFCKFTIQTALKEAYDEFVKTH